MQTGLTYGAALEAAKQGKLISRFGWNGKGMFVFMQKGEVISSQIIDPRAFNEQARKFLQLGSEQAPINIIFTPFMCMKAADGSIVIGWLASQTDMLSDDWCILDEIE